jgi:hypothetical protein
VEVEGTAPVAGKPTVSGSAPAARLRHERLARLPRGGLSLDAAIAHHVTMRLVDDRVVAPTTARRRQAAHVLMGRGRARGLIAFRIADTHLHALVVCPRDEAGAFARATEVGLHFVLGLPVAFEPARIRPVLDQRHLGNSFRYILRQEERHGIAADPLHDGSSLADLLGLRTVGAYMRATVAANLPRIRGEELLTYLGVDLGIDLDAVPSAFGAGSLSAAPPLLGGVNVGAVPIDPRDLADAAAASLGLTRLSGRSRAHRAAQSAAVHLAKRAGLRQEDVAQSAGISSRTVRRFDVRPVHDEAVLHAVELQLLLRKALGPRAADGTP